MGVRCWWIDINLLPSISVCGFSLFAERLLFDLWVLWEISSPTNLLYSFSHRVTQKNRFHKGGTETLSQPIAQNVTAIVKCWVIDIRCWWLAIRVTSVITSLRERCRYLSCSLFILFLTGLHRRKYFTKVHRDIKSTESTECYNYYWVLGDRC